ncbi:MAG: membrane-associated protein [Wenzhouxiangella sp.]|nr:MAG: membrane-associated protein [Wenzhouxiangella sp.]
MIPLWLKLLTTLGTAAIVVIYWHRYGPGNLLWFCDLSLILLVPAVWLESSLLTSLAALLVLLPLLAWTLLLGIRLLTGWREAGLLDYMFESERPWLLRLLSLFHIPLAALLLYLLGQLGYDERALPLAALSVGLVLPLTRWLTPPERNVNWVHGIGGEGTRQQSLPAWGYLLCLVLIAIALIHLPSHWLLFRLF